MVEQELVHAIEAVLNSKKKLSKAESKVIQRTAYQPKTHTNSETSINILPPPR